MSLAPVMSLTVHAFSLYHSLSSQYAGCSTHTVVHFLSWTTAYSCPTLGLALGTLATIRAAHLMRLPDGGSTWQICIGRGEGVCTFDLLIWFFDHSAPFCVCFFIGIAVLNAGASLANHDSP